MPDRPDGTVTFLFTDIEGSMRLARQYPTPRLAPERIQAVPDSSAETYHCYVREIEMTLQSEEFVRAGDATIHVTIHGSGPAVVCLPSLGRGVEDFSDLGIRLVQAGYRVILPQPRGIAPSTGPLDGITLHDLGADVAAVISAVDGAPAALVGHAMGNRVARVVATDYPALVRQVILLAAGGMVAPQPDIRAAFDRVFEPGVPPAERLEAIGHSFFAPGNDPTVWEQRWHVDTAAKQRAAGRATAVQDWWAAGSAPIVVLQGTADVIAPPGNAKLLRGQYPDRVIIVDIPGAGHAMLPEQPALIASAILTYLKM